MWDKIQHSDNTILCTKENAKRFKHVKAFAHKFLEAFLESEQSSKSTTTVLLFRGNPFAHLVFIFALLLLQRIMVSLGFYKSQEELNELLTQIWNLLNYVEKNNKEDCNEN